MTPHLFASPIGKLYLLLTELGVCDLSFAGVDHESALERAMAVHGLKPASRSPLLPRLVRELEGYFDGRGATFRTPVFFLEGTDFQRRVWSALRAIPRGRCESYARVARRIGVPGGSRAVGGAVGANPVPLLIPCHRVISSDGSIGGYSGGIHIKKKLLALERP